MENTRTIYKYSIKFFPPGRAAVMTFQQKAENSSQAGGPAGVVYAAWDASELIGFLKEGYFALRVKGPPKCRALPSAHPLGSPSGRAKGATRQLCCALREPFKRSRLRRETSFKNKKAAETRGFPCVISLFSSAPQGSAPAAPRWSAWDPRQGAPRRLLRPFCGPRRPRGPC